MKCKNHFTDVTIGNAEEKNKSLAHQSTVFDTEQIFPWIVKDLADFS